ncbi:MAG TPA: hypothetical protein VK837_14130 [Longimicrobiales bacterium]|nr:hypothetical protein [Longimicrobiales bacterium]
MRTLMIAAVAALSLGSLALACEQSTSAGAGSEAATADAEMAPARDNEVTSLEDIAPGFEVEDDADAAALDPLGPRAADGIIPPAGDPRGQDGVRAGDGDGFAVEGQRIDLAPDEEWRDAERAGADARAATPQGGAGGADGAGSEPSRVAEPAPARRVNFSLEEIQGRGAATAPAAGGVVPAGSVVAVRLDEQLSTSSNDAGDAFTVTTTQPMLDDLGRVAIPAGSRLQGRVLAVDGADADGETSMLVLGFESVSVAGRTYPLSGTVVEANPQRRKPTATRGTAAKVGAGAAVGAILGQIIGKDTEATVIGAAAGAAAGTAIALGTRDVEAVLPAGSAMTIRLDAPVRVATN